MNDMKNMSKQMSKYKKQYEEISEEMCLLGLDNSRLLDISDD
jgi:hypothetical protein